MGSALGPGGLTPADEGARFSSAAADAVRRSAPDTDTSPIPYDRKADLVVVTEPGPPDLAAATLWHADGVVHLAAQVSGTSAVIGPLVLPGVSSCLRCGDLHRADRDSSWPAMAVQLTRSDSPTMRSSSASASQATSAMSMIRY